MRSCEWVLLLDADEQATTAWAREIVAPSVRRAPPTATGFSACCYHLGHYLPGRSTAIGPYGSSGATRTYGGVDPHDNVIVNGRVGRLSSPILHFSYRDIADHVDDDESLQHAEPRQMQPTAMPPRKMFSNAVWRFFNFYILRGGFLDGGRGLYAAMTAAFYVFLKYSKAYERRLKTLIRVDARASVMLAARLRYRVAVPAPDR